MFRKATMICRATCLVAFLGPTTPAAELQERSDFEKGKTLYRSLCQRCHGPDGDATSYPGVVPVVGVQRRLDEEEIVRVAAGTLGRSFDADEGRALYAFLKTLKGAKGFAQAGLLFSPHLAETKIPKTRQYRLIDARTRAEYEAGHIPNAVHWPDPVEAFACRLSRDEMASVLASVGVTPETFVVIYDGGGGPEAACVWWALVSAGHDRAAVLDGGWRRWINESRRVQTAQVPMPRRSRRAGSSEPQDDRCDFGMDEARALRFDWQDIIDESGFRAADEVGSVLREAGFRGRGTYLIPGSPTDTHGAAFALKLLGYESVVVHRDGSGVRVGTR
jgi:rhodanese-related sulfurtransferase